MKHLSLIVAAISLLLTWGPVSAQDVTPPETFNDALAALSQSIDETVTANNIDSYTWQAETFNSTAIGCPQDGQAYAQMVVEGYIYGITYQGLTYEVHTNAEGTQAIVCGEPTQSQPSQQPTATPTLAPVQDCAATVTVAEGDTLFDIAQRCNTTVGALVEANQGLQTRTEILIPGEDLAVPDVTSTQPIVEGITDDTAPDTDIQPTLAIYPTTGPVETTVQVIANDLPENAPFEVRLAPLVGDSLLLDTINTTDDGSAYYEFNIPITAEVQSRWTVTLESVDGTASYISDVYLVTG